MLLRVLLPYALAVGAVLPACEVSRPLREVGDEWPREAIVSARHSIPADGGDVTDLTVSTIEDRLSLRWMERGHARAVASMDAGRTLADAAPASQFGIGPTVHTAFDMSHVRDRTWLVVPGAEAYYNVDWTTEADSAYGAPFAMQELCGLAAIVAVEPTQKVRRVVLRRYLPPRLLETAAQLIGAPVELGAVEARVGAIAAGAFIESAVVAWVDTTAVQVVRVELPDVLCAGRMPRLPS